MNLIVWYEPEILNRDSSFGKKPVFKMLFIKRKKIFIFIFYILKNDTEGLHHAFAR